MPKVSVIVPMYNAEDTICRCLDSILASTVDFEILLIDDGSNDKTAMICDEYKKKNANIYVYIEGKNYSDIPVWRRYTLTIEEAARYYHIGEGKLRTLIDTHPNEDFYVMNGNRALIKREKFERYLDQATAV